VNRYQLLATAVLTIHLVWIAWVIFGWPLVRNHPALRWAHFAALIYGIFIEIAPWPCPLTLLEQSLESAAGITPYQQPFLVHYLEALIYPDIPELLLIVCAVAVCGINLALHVRRMLRRNQANSR
jgi:hypothetical protein